MANQLNIGLQRQSYEAFEAVDSDTENQNTDASLADDSADTNTGGNPTTPTIIGSPQVEGENGHQAPPETVAANNMLNRYGISDCIIIQRPEYAINNRAAPAATPTNFPQTPDPVPICPAQTDLASLGLETSAQVGSKPLKKPITGAASYAKDAANTAPVTSHGTKLPPRDSVAYTAAREYGAQHGYDAEQTNQLAALFAYYHCETPQHCKDMLDSLPFHIATIMQAIGGARADGTFDVGLALRGLQETQVMMNGDPNAANEHLSDLGMLATASGGGGALGAVHGSTRAGEGQGAEDYANEMSMASSTGDATYFDYGDESYDAADNAPPPNPEPLPSLPSVEATGPIMLLLPDIHLDNELLPIPTIEIAANQSASTLEGAGASTSTLSTRPEDNPNFMGYNTNGQSLFSDPATQRYAPSGIGETGYRLTGLSTAVQGSILGFDTAGTPYSGVRNAAGEISWYALGFAEATSIMSAHASGSFLEAGALSLAGGVIPSASMAVFTMVMPSNAGRDTIITDLADGSRFVAGAGALEGHLEIRDDNGNWAVAEHSVGLDARTGTAFSMLTDDQRRAAGLPPSLLPPNPSNGLLTNPVLTNDERNRLNGTTISPIQPGSLPPLGGFQIAPPQTIDDLIIESSRAPNGTARANGYDYEFDGNSRIDNVEGDLNREDGIRNRGYQSGAGGADRLPDDDGGHIVGNRFNPPGEEFNYIAQNSNFNRGEYRQLENEWARLLGDRHTVRVQWDFEYTGSSQRPDAFVVTYWVDGGDPIVRPFQNRLGGK